MVRARLFSLVALSLFVSACSGSQLQPGHYVSRNADAPILVVDQKTDKLLLLDRRDGRLRYLPTEKAAGVVWETPESEIRYSFQQEGRKILLSRSGVRLQGGKRVSFKDSFVLVRQDEQVVKLITIKLFLEQKEILSREAVDDFYAAMASERLSRNPTLPAPTKTVSAEPAVVTEPLPEQKPVADISLPASTGLTAALKKKLAAKIDTAWAEGRHELGFESVDASIRESLKTQNADAALAPKISKGLKDALLPALKEQIVTQYAGTYSRIREYTTMAVRLAELEGGKEVVEYFERAYGKDVSDLLVLVGDARSALAGFPSTGGGISGITAAFIPPQAPTNEMPIPSVPFPLNAVSEKANGNVTISGSIALNGLTTMLVQESMIEAFGTQYVLFVDKASLVDNAEDLSWILVHETRHYLDYLQNPKYFTAAHVLGERNKSIQISRASGVAQKEYEAWKKEAEYQNAAKVLEEHFSKQDAADPEAKTTAVLRDLFNKVENARPYLDNPQELRAYREQVRFLVEKSYSAEKVLERMIATTGNAYADLGGGKKLKVPVPPLLRKYFTGLWNDEMAELK
ncbi:hypothetical protein K2X33_16480 [bacterium]|nr:hypothetical protein [bacterium]